MNGPVLSFSDIAELMKGPNLELHFSRMEAIIKFLLMKYSTIQTEIAGSKRYRPCMYDEFSSYPTRLCGLGSMQAFLCR